MVFEPNIHGGVPINKNALSVQVSKLLPLEELFSIIRDFIRQGIRFGVLPGKDSKFTVWRAPLPGDLTFGFEEDIRGGVVDPFPPAQGSFFMVFENGQLIKEGVQTHVA